MTATMTDTERMRDAYRAAVMHFEQGKSQVEIAKGLGLSRSQVTRLIDAAKEMGLVNIRVLPPPLQPLMELEQQLIDRFDLKDAIVTLSPGMEMAEQESGVARVNHLVGLVAADYFDKTVENNEKILISAGTTIGTLVQHVAPGRLRMLDISALVATPAMAPDWSTTFLIGYLCIRLQRGAEGGGKIRPHTIPVPGYLKKVEGESPEEQKKRLEEQKESLLRLSGIDDYEINEEGTEIVGIKGEIDRAFVGVGSLEGPSTLIRLINTLGVDVNELKGAGACGAIGYKVYDEGGVPIKCDFSDRIIGLPLRYLKILCDDGKPVVGTAGGKAKVKSILGAIKAGYINVLITDDETARELLNEAGSSTT